MRHAARALLLCTAINSACAVMFGASGASVVAIVMPLGTPGSAQNAVLQEYLASADGMALEKLTLPTACYLPAPEAINTAPSGGRVYGAEGTPANTLDGNFVIFPCYTGVTITGAVDISAPKAVALVPNNSTEAALVGPFDGFTGRSSTAWSGLRSVASVSGSDFYVLGGGATTYGVQYYVPGNLLIGIHGSQVGDSGLTFAGAISLQYRYSSTVPPATRLNPFLAAGFDYAGGPLEALVTLKAGVTLPTSHVTPSNVTFLSPLTTLLAATAGDIWDTVADPVEPYRVIWMAIDASASGGAPGTLMWAYLDGTDTMSFAVNPSMPLYSLAALPISGNVRVAYVFAASAYNIYAFEVGMRLSAGYAPVLITTAPPGCTFRGVAAPPLAPLPSPSISSSPHGTLTSTTSSSTTPSASQTSGPSLSQSLTASSTGSRTFTATTTITRTSSRSGTLTPSAVSTNTPSASHTYTSSPSITLTSSASRTTTGSMSRTTTPSPSLTDTPSSSLSATSSSSRTSSHSLSNTITLAPSQTATPSSSITALLTSSRTAAQTISDTRTALSTSTATGSMSSAATLSASRSPSQQPTPSTTTTSSPYSAYLSCCNIVVLRLDHCVGAVAGILSSVQWDEVNPALPFASNVRQSIPIRTNGTATSVCALASGTQTWLYDTDGLPSNSVDRTLATIICWNQAVGGQVTDGTGAQDSGKIITTLDWTGTVAFSSPIYNLELSIDTQVGIRQVATVDGSAFWVAGSGLQVWGFVYIASIAIVSPLVVQVSGLTSNQPGYNDARAVTIFNGQLYGSDIALQDPGWGGVFSIGVGLPSAPASPAAVTLGFASGASLWTFVFQNASTIWAAADSQTVTGTAGQAVVVQYTQTAAIWSTNPSRTQLIDPSRLAYSIAGRFEASVNATCNATGSFVLYVATQYYVYRWDTSTAAVVAVYAPSASSCTRGVALAPCAPPPSQSPTSLPTSTPTQTISTTSTKSSTPTVSQTATSTSPTTWTGTASTTATATSSSSTTVTPTVTATSRRTSTSTNTVTSMATLTSSSTTTSAASISKSFSPTVTRTSLPSVTSTGTQSWTSTSSTSKSLSTTPTPSESSTHTPSLMGTGSSTLSYSSTSSGTGTVTGTVTSTSSLTGSPSASCSLTSSMSGQPPIGAGHILVLRLDTCVPPVLGVGVLSKLHWDEADPTGAIPSNIVRSIPIDSNCTLASGRGQWDFDNDGLPSNSGDHTLALTVCYNEPAGTLVTITGPSGQDVGKRITTVDWRGVTILSSPIYGLDTGGVAFETGIRQVATQNGSVFWVAGEAVSGWGFVYVPSMTGTAPVTQVSGVKVTQPGWNDARGVTVFDGQLYGVDSTEDIGWGGIFSIGMGLPTTEGSPAAQLLTGFAGTMSLWTFVFESPTVIWAATDMYAASSGLGVVICIAQSSGVWTQTRMQTINATWATYSIAGRTENGNFVLYVATHYYVYRWDSTSIVAPYPVYVPPSTGCTRGVALAPLPTAASTTSPSPSTTAQPTPSKSSAETGTITVTATVTTTPVSTPTTSMSLTLSTTSTQTASSTTTTSGTAASTTTSSTTPTSTVTSSITMKPTVTTSPTSTSTTSESGTAATTTTATETPTLTLTPSMSVTSSATATLTGSSTATTSGTCAITATVTVTQSSAPTATSTAAMTTTASATATATATGTTTPLPTSTQSLTPTAFATTTVTAAWTATTSGTATLSATSAATPTSTSTISQTQSCTRTSTFTPTVTAVRTRTPTSSGTMTSSLSATSTVSQTASSTASHSQSQTASSIATTSATITTKPSYSQSSLPSMSASADVTPTVSPSNTLTQSMPSTPSVTQTPFATMETACADRPTQYLFGYTGTSAQYDLSKAQIFLGGAELGCAVPSADARKQLFELDLGHSAPLGYNITVDVCDSNFDTQLWVGTGCPSTDFGCTAQTANDDSHGCGVNNWGSRVTFTATTRTLFIVVGGALSAHDNYTVAWKFAGVSWSPSSSSATSGTASPSSAETPSPTSTWTASSALPSGEPSSSASRSSTTVDTPTAASTRTSSQTRTQSHSRTRTMSPSRTRTRTRSSSHSRTQTRQSVSRTAKAK